MPKLVRFQRQWEQNRGIKGVLDTPVHHTPTCVCVVAGGGGGGGGGVVCLFTFIFISHFFQVSKMYLLSQMHYVYVTKQDLFNCKFTTKPQLLTIAAGTE